MSRAVVFALLVACSSATPARDNSEPRVGGTAPPTYVPSAPTPDFVSGSRLRAEVWTVGDASTFHGWFDSQINAECTFRLAEDGRLRCLPSGATLTYSDDSCTTPLNVQAPGSSTAPVYAVTDDACAPSTVYVGTGMPTALQPDWIVGPSGQCQYYPGQWEYTNIAKMDASMFVAGEITTLALDSLIGAQVLVAEDGATARLWAHDLVHDDDCDLPTTVGSPTCVPRAKAGDGTCSVGALLACANAAPKAITTVDGSCTITTSTAAPSSSCSGRADQIALTAGAPFDAPALGQTLTGEGRIHLVWETSAASAAPIHVVGFFDDAIQALCTSGKTSDGVTRCVPKATLARAYADAQCTVMANVPDDYDVCMPSSSWIGIGGHYYRNATAIPEGSPIYYQGGYSNCITWGTATVGSYIVEPVDDSTFAELTSSTQ